jgi:hypothetical protein
VLKGISLLFIAFVNTTYCWKFYYLIFPPTVQELYRREVLYSILMEFGVPMKLVTLIKMCLCEIHSKIHIAEHFSDNIPVQRGLKQDALLPLLLNFTL